MDAEVGTTTVAPVETVAPVQVTTPAPATGGGDDVFENMTSQKPMDFKSLLIVGLIVAFSIYGITYYRKAIQKMNEDKKTSEEFLNLVDDVEEVKYNVKRALGKRYTTT
jgi:uncharacterized protein with LGFP repeats